MSYSVEWINPIFDRTYGDVITAEGQRNLVNPKGCYNYSDLNRIENNTKYVMEDMLVRKIIRTPPALAIKLNWNETDIPTREDMSRIIGNIRLLMDLSNPEVFDTFYVIYESTQFTYSLANAIEYNLQIMKDQPELPIQKWLLKINNGIIDEYNASSAYIAEEEIVTIRGIPSGPDATYMTFDNWSGNADDLQYVSNKKASPTKYTMKYHNDDNYVVELTANFKTRIPRTLTLNGGRIYDDVGGSTRQFFAGDEILLLANVADTGKAFYEWRGTQEGLDNLTGGPEPSTSWLVMPDCNVTLSSFYINAGQHSVRVDGSIQGWYDYNDLVTISANAPSNKHVFKYWSGDTGYLGDVTNSSFNMPDVNVNFYSNWEYIPDKYQVVVNNGNGSGIYNDNDSFTISAVAPSENMGFLYWTLDEGNGYISDEYSQSTTFHMTTSNAVITAHFAPIHTVSVNNYNNSGNVYTIRVTEGKSYTIESQWVVGTKTIDYYEVDDGTKIGTPYFTETMGSSDRVYTVVYRDRETYTLTVNNGTGSGQYLERASVAISANAVPEGKQFYYWNTSSNIWSISNRYSASTTVEIGYGDCSVTPVYQDIPTPPVYTYYDITVNNGSGSGTYTSGTWITCRGDRAPSGYEFSHWEENGNIISYSYSYGFRVNSNRTITANYKLIPYFTVTVVNGKLADGSTSGTFLRNSQPKIIMDPAPEGMKFLQWEVLIGDDNDVSQPLAETTNIRNLVHDVKVQATYYVPNTETPYNLSITGIDGTTTTTQHTVGEQVTIYADEPYEGQKFIRWVGDTQYLIDRYATPTIVNMPPRNISLEMKYDFITAVTKYHVKLFGGELLVETDTETGEETWDIESDFEEGTKVRIRAIDIPLGWKFNGWKNDNDDGKSVSTVNALAEPETFLIVEDFPIELTRDVIEKEKYSLQIKDGEIAGSYYEGDPVPIYFSLENTELVNYTFIRWSGDTSYLKIFETGFPFDITVAGTPDNPQNIRMPKKNIDISAMYTTYYGLYVDDVLQGYYTEGDTVEISAEEIEGKRFTYWTGDIDNVDNKYNPNITVTMPKRSIKLTTNYHNINDNNYVGYSLTNLSNNDTINIENITIISGDVSVGFLITDNNGHIYIVTEVNDNTAKIMRLTSIQGGDENG